MSDADDRYRWVPVGPPTAPALAPACRVVVEGCELALFAVGGAHYAIDCSCPHAGGSLAEGDVRGTEVACPWHGWRFDLATGACKTVPEAGVQVYPVRLQDGVLEVGLPRA
jgi:nitrite reductase/ring-hydroxylating ferredoxin subunit